MWQAKGPNVHLSPGLAKEDAGVVPGCLGLCPYWGREGLCAHPQYWRRSLRKLPEGRAARRKLKSGQVEARDHNGSAVARILRGRLPRPGPALQWTRNQCRKRRSLCDRHRVRALERAKARAGGQGWEGRSVGRSAHAGRVAVAVAVVRSQSPCAVGVGVAIAIARHTGLVAPHTQGTGKAQAREYRHKHRHRHRVGG